MNPRQYGLVVALFALLSALGQLSTNIYLPSLIDVGRDLNGSDSQIQLSVTVFLAVFALGQLFYGPLSDRYGRIRVIFGGTSAFIVGSLVCAFADNIWILWLGRALQGAGAGASVIVVRALARDMFEGAELQRTLSLINSLFAIVPAVAPLIGTGLATVFHWRADFIAPALLAAALLATLLLVVPEPRAERLKSLNFRLLVALVSAKLTDRFFMAYAISSGLMYGALFSFLTQSPILLIQQFDISKESYSLLMLIGVGCLVAGSLFAARMASRNQNAIYARGVALGFFVGVVCLACFAFVRLHIAILLLPVFAFMFLLGFLMPVAIGIVLERYGSSAGTASSALGFVHMICGTLSTVIVVAISDLGIVSLAATILLLAVSANFVLFIGQPHRFPRSSASS